MNCSIDGCDKPVKTRNKHRFCTMHDKRMRRWGDPHHVVTPDQRRKRQPEPVLWDELTQRAVDRYMARTDAELAARNINRIAEHWRDHGTEGVPERNGARSDKPWAVPKQRRTTDTWTRKEIMEARG